MLYITVNRFAVPFSASKYDIIKDVKQFQEPQQHRRDKEAQGFSNGGEKNAERTVSASKQKCTTNTAPTKFNLLFFLWLVLDFWTPHYLSTFIKAVHWTEAKELVLCCPVTCFLFSQWCETGQLIHILFLPLGWDAEWVLHIRTIINIFRKNVRTNFYLC